jgi:acyl-CoA thioester hydrolase
MKEMDDRWPDLAGNFQNGTHVLPVRVYHEDTDFSGLVYHANYLRFCERGRSDCLRLLGVHHTRLGGAGFVVRRMVCEFLRPARIAEILEVHTAMTGISGARLNLHQKIARRGDDLFVAEVVVALVGSSGRPIRIPLDVASALRAPA